MFLLGKIFRSKSVSIILGLILTFTAYGAGEVDTTFSTAAFSIVNSGVTVAVAQPDGKVLIGGNFTVANSVARYGLARLNADGTLDTSFDPPDFFDSTLPFNSLGGTIKAIALQSNGKILVGGKFKITGSTYESLVRLNTNGSIDASFNNLSDNIEDHEEIRRIVVSPDDTFTIGGNIQIIGQSTSSIQVVKFDANGNFNPTFRFPNAGGGLKDVVVQADGKVIACDLHAQRHNADGTVDDTYPIVVSGGINRMVLRPDGKLLIGGDFSTVNSFSQGRIALINSDGSLDLNFNLNGIGAGGGIINDTVLAPDGKIFIGGTFTHYNGVAKNKIAKLNADGTLDTSFTYTPPNINTVIKDLELLSSGKLIIAGDQTATANDSVSRLNTDGSVDSAFSAKIGRNERVNKIIQLPDGKILIAGRFRSVLGVTRVSIARLNSDGSLDPTFVPYFNNGGLATIMALAVQPDGKILVGFFGSLALRRLNPDGSQDMSFIAPFSSGAIINDIAVLPNNQIMVGGLISFNEFIYRLNANGAPDSSFVPAQPNNIVNKIQLQPDGKFYACGDFTQVGSSLRGRIAKFNADGSLDNTFNPPGGANNGIFDCKVQADGKVVLGGYYSALNGSANHRFIGRLNTDGSLDTSFVQTVNGPAVNSQVTTVEIQPDGKILIGGIFTDVGGIPRNNIARLNTNGTLDPTFIASATAQVFDISLQTDNKILVGGDFTKINNISSIAAARLLNSLIAPRTLFDYDGDGKADVSVFRPSTNRWYVFKSSDSTVSEATFGLAGDVVAPADYDGDGKTDLGIFRPSSGDWWYQSSINNAQISVHWGASGDVPRPSDFDGDGKADFIVFRPSNNVWYRFGSTGATSITPFGLSGDKPVTGDFDGDGKSDLAIYRPSAGTWWYQSSINNAQLAVQWGISTDIPAPADYDGDGKTDFVVYRPSTGVWYVISSSNGSFLIMAFGIAEDKPVPADYDGDGKADIAVFRPSTGTWYQMKTTAGFAAQQFGVSTDIPTENAFVP